MYVLFIKDKLDFFIKGYKKIYINDIKYNKKY